MHRKVQFLSSPSRTIFLAVIVALTLVLAIVPASAQNSVPPTAVQAAKMPQFASRLAHPAKRLLPPETSAMQRAKARRGPLQADDIYDNGPINGNTDAWTINFGFIVTDAHRRKFDAVLVWKIDRFGRSLKHLVNALADLCAYGVAFVSFRDNLDLSTPSGRLMFQIIGAMAEFERSLIQERVKAGLRNARAKGKRLGRPVASVDASRIMAMRDSGLSWREISGELGIGVATAHRIGAEYGRHV